MHHHANRHVKHVASKSTQPWVFSPTGISTEQPDPQSFPFAYTNGVRHFMRGIGVLVTTRRRRKAQAIHSMVAA